MATSFKGSHLRSLTREEQRVFDAMINLDERAASASEFPPGCYYGVAVVENTQANNPRLSIYQVRSFFRSYMEETKRLACAVQGCLTNPRTDESADTLCAACLPDQVHTEGVREVLFGHTSEENAYVIPDYPYGRTLRCRKKVWIETQPGKGQRMVSRTTNPKKVGREVWNKPHASTYSDLMVLYLDAAGHVQQTGFGYYGNEAQLTVFASQFAAALTDDYAETRMRSLRTTFLARENITVRVTSGAGEGQTPGERGAIIAGAIHKAERRIANEDFDAECPNADRHAPGYVCPMCSYGRRA
jgi:hypothetical protein